MCVILAPSLEESCARCANMILRLLSVVLAVATSLYSSTGSLVGTIVGPSSKALAGAVVVVKNEETGAERTAETNGLGDYAIPALSPGFYRIAVSAPEFQTATRTGIQLVVGDTLRIDMMLALAGQATSVDVSERFQLLDTDSATRGQVVGRRRLSIFP